MIKPIRVNSMKAAVIALSFAALSYAQDSQPTNTAQPTLVAASKIQPAAQIAEYTEDEMLVRGTLENGLNYMIRPTTEPKGRMSVRLHVNIGSLDEVDETSGISHFLEHLMFNGSRSYKRGELIPAMQKMGVGFGGDANAYTGLNETVYMMDLPNIKDETVEFVFTVMRDFADGATLDDEAIEKERGIIVSELKARDSVSYRASIEGLRQITEGARIADFLPIGTEEVIMNAPYELFRDYYRTHYVAKNMTVIVTGDVKPEQAAQWIKKHFSSMEGTAPTPRPALVKELNTGRSTLVLSNPENALTAVNLTVTTPWVKKENTIAQDVEDMPLQLACAMLNRRLDKMTRDENNSFNRASVGQSDVYQAANVFSISLTAKPENWKEAIAAVEQEVRSAIAHGFTQAELNEILAQSKVAYESAITAWTDVSAQSMASSLVETCADKTLALSPMESYRGFQHGAFAIMEDPDRCRKALAAEYKPEQMKLNLTGTLAEDATAENLEAVYDAATKTEVKARAEEKELVFAYDHIGEPGKVVAQSQIEDLGITCLTLSNGIRVNLKPIDFKKGYLSVDAEIDGGLLQLPTDKPGFSTLASSVMGMGGLEAHKADELRQILAAYKVGVSFGMDEERLSFGGTTRKEDFEMQCKLIAAYILHPGYAPEGEMLLRRNLPAVYNQMRTTPQGAFQMQGMRAIFDDSRFVFPEQAELEARTTAEVKEALTPFLKDGAMEVTIVGDFDVAELIPTIERTLGAMPARKAEFNTISDEARKAKFKAWGTREFLRYPTELDKTIVTQVRFAGDGSDKRRNRRLQVLNSIVREKLFDGIRAVLGETYSPSVSIKTHGEFKDAAFIITASEGVKRNRTKVNTAMDVILQELGTGAITAEDFERAIKPILSSLDKNERNTDFWRSRVRRAQTDAESIELLRDLKADTTAITLEEVQELAKEIFGPQQKVKYLFTVPENFDANEEKAEEKDEAKEAAFYSPAAPQVYASVPAPTNNDVYAVVISEETIKSLEWKKVANALMAKYPNTKLITLEKLNDCAGALAEVGARYAAFVARPEEVDYILVNDIHRAARKVDDDPWGDCMWGIITGYEASDALRIAKDTKPLGMKRALATTNIDHTRFEHSACITDWQPYQVFEQTGYTEAKETIFNDETDPDKSKRKAGIQVKFVEELETQRPELVVTSSHATEFNLEMPFERGLIFPSGNRYHGINEAQKFDYVANGLSPANRGNVEALDRMVKKLKPRTIQPDGQTRVWLAAGNCLFGNVRKTRECMAVTALSGYTCNQVVGYTVPSWYGDGGWGTLSMLFSNADGTSLADAWYLNNQFIIKKTMDISPNLLKAEFNEREIGGPGMQKLGQAIAQQGCQTSKDAMGVVHDRDVVAFFGDPKWQASLSDEKAHTPFIVKWEGSKKISLTANFDHKGRVAFWYPERQDVKECNIPGAVVTNDFVLIPELEAKKGDTVVIELK